MWVSALFSISAYQAKRFELRGGDDDDDDDEAEPGEGGGEDAIS